MAATALRYRTFFWPTTGNIGSAVAIVAGRWQAVVCDLFHIRQGKSASHKSIFRFALRCHAAGFDRAGYDFGTVIAYRSARWFLLCVIAKTEITLLPAY